MKERINDKIKEIEEYLSIILEFIPLNLEDYINDLRNKAACEHYFEKIVEACEDLAFLLLRFKKIEFLEEESVFSFLSENNLLDKELAKKLQEAKSMRNFISHEYGKIDDEIVFEAISSELENDVRKFIKEIVGYIKDGYQKY